MSLSGLIGLPIAITIAITITVISTLICTTAARNESSGGFLETFCLLDGYFPRSTGT